MVITFPVERTKRGSFDIAKAEYTRAWLEYHCGAISSMDDLPNVDHSLAFQVGLQEILCQKLP